MDAFISSVPGELGLKLSYSSGVISNSDSKTAFAY